MRKLFAVAAVALAITSVAYAAAPKGAVHGKFTIGALAATDPLAKYVKGTAVWCAWKKDHVIVHVNLKNGSAEHITASIEPAYDILRGSTHGAGITNLKNFGVDGGAFRSLWIDAGKPKGVAPHAVISRCHPSLFLVKSG